MNRHLPIEQDLTICKNCALYENKHVRTPCMIGTYSKPAKHKENKQCDIMVVVESPEYEDEAITASGIMKDEVVVYNNSAGEILRISLNSIDAHDYYITYIVKCRCAMPRGDRNAEPLPKMIKSCKYYYLKELEMVNPKYVLLLGNSAMSGAIGKRGIKTYHGTPFSIAGRTYVATYNVTDLKRSTKLLYPYKDDINLFEKVIKASGDLITLREPVMHELADTMPRVMQMFKELISAGSFAFDIEASGLNPWKKSPYFGDPPAVVCIAFSTKAFTAWVLPIDHPESPFNEEEKATIHKLLKAIMENPKIKKVAHNSKYDIKYIDVVKGIKTQGLISDTMIESYLLNEEQGQHRLKDLALRFTDLGDYEAKLEEARKEMVKLGPKKGGLPKSEEYNYMRYPLDMIFTYAACDADTTIRLRDEFEPLLKKQGLLEVRDTIMLKINEILIRIEYNGAKLDVPYALEKTKEYEKMIEDQEKLMLNSPEIQYIQEYYQVKAAARAIITYKKKYLQAKEKLIEFCKKTFKLTVEEFLDKIDRKPLKDRLVLLKSLRVFEDLLTPEEALVLRAKEQFKFNSIFHMQHLIYDYLGEKVFKKTDSKQPAVDEEVLTTFAPKHEILTEVLKYKKLTKFLSTYIAPSTTTWLCDDGYVHTLYSLHGTVTGRLASKQPNMQNLPRDDKVVKSMFISRFEGGQILNCDYSQLELRVLAIYSRDKGLIDAYNSGKDLHTNTASIILGKDFDAVTKDERQIFKAINFLIVYGGTAMALAAKVDIEEPVAQKFMDDYFRMFPGVTDYVRKYQEYASKNKYVRCLTGRIRRLYDVDSDKDWVREEALRMAINCPVQSVASDITQISLYNLQKVFDKVGVKSLIIGTVHDSAFIDLYPGELQKVCNIIETVFENPTFDFLKENGKYIIPFKCDIEVGPNYGNLTHVVKEDGVWKVVEKKD
jgi:uracil-DNA glycosylase family 4